MSIPKPPFRSVSEELLYNIYLKMTGTTVDETALLAAIRGNVPPEADTLEKIYNIIQGLNFLAQSDIDTLDKLNTIITDADLASKVDIANLIDNAADAVNTLQKLYTYFESSKENKIEKGTANGYAPLDATGKIPAAHIPETHFLGKFPSLAALVAEHAIANAGDYAHIDSGIGVAAKEYLYDAEEGWLQSSASAGVTSFNGRSGPVTSAGGDYTTDQITETGTRVFVSPSEKANIRPVAIQAEAETAADPTVANRDNSKALTSRSFRWAFDAVWAWVRTQAQAISAVWNFPTPALGLSSQQAANMQALQDEVGKVLILLISGAYTIDLSTGRKFIITLADNVILDYANAIEGKSYLFLFKQATTYKTVTLAPGRFSNSYGNALQLTNPGAGTAKDFISGEYLDGVMALGYNPDHRNN
jgi:hypothetical protein